MRKSESACSEGPDIAGKCWYWSLSSDAVDKYIYSDGEGL